MFLIKLLTLIWKIQMRSLPQTFSSPKLSVLITPLVSPSETQEVVFLLWYGQSAFAFVQKEVELNWERSAWNIVNVNHNVTCHCPSLFTNPTDVKHILKQSLPPNRKKSIWLTILWFCRMLKPSHATVICVRKRDNYVQRPSVSICRQYHLSAILLT